MQMYQKTIINFFFYLILYNVFFQKNNTLLGQNKDIFQKIFSDSTENTTNILPKQDSSHFYIIEEINLFSERNKTDLIVMGMQGAGYLAEKVIGSITTSLMPKAKCPILVIDEKTPTVNGWGFWFFLFIQWRF